jgi:hypothetical protein
MGFLRRKRPAGIFRKGSRQAGKVSFFLLMAGVDCNNICYMPNHHKLRRAFYDNVRRDGLFAMR